MKTEKEGWDGAKRLYKVFWTERNIIPDCILKAVSWHYRILSNNHICLLKDFPGGYMESKLEELNKNILQEFGKEMIIIWMIIKGVEVEKSRWI